jgi:hypothetical protein
MQKMKAESLADLVRMASSLGISHASFEVRYTLEPNSDFSAASVASAA